MAVSNKAIAGVRETRKGATIHKQSGGKVTKLT